MQGVFIKGLGLGLQSLLRGKIHLGFGSVREDGGLKGLT